MSTSALGPHAPAAATGAATPTRHDGALDGVRALAVLLVILTHAGFLTGATVNGGFLGRLAGRGDYGVHLFFALSAFLLHRGFLIAEVRGRRLNLRAYAVRRFARVVPAYWVVLLVVVLATGTSWRDTVLHVFSLQVYVADASIPAFSQAWSVATELSFYAVLPFLSLGLARLRRWRIWAPPVALTAAALVSLATLASVGVVRVGKDVLPDRWLTGVAAVFLAGMLLAEAAEFPRSGRISALLHRWAGKPESCLAIGVATYVLASTPIAGSLLLLPGHGPTLTARILLGTVFAMTLLIPLTLGGPNPIRTALGHPVARWLGEVSYGIFLWHVPVFFFIHWWSGVPEFSGGMVPLLTIGIPISILLGWLSHVLVEAPLIRWAARGPAGRPGPT